MLGNWGKKDQSSMQFKSLIPATAAGGGLSSSMYKVNRGPAVSQAIDQGLIWAVLALLFLGLVMVYSATVALPDSNKYANYQTTHFLVRHAVSIAVAFVAAFCVFPDSNENLARVGAIGLFVLHRFAGLGADSWNWQRGKWCSPMALAVCTEYSAI